MSQRLFTAPQTGTTLRTRADRRVEAVCSVIDRAHVAGSARGLRVGIARRGDINYFSGHAIVEATHGAAPKHADKDIVNPGSVAWCGESLRCPSWLKAADSATEDLDGAITVKTDTYDFHRRMDGARLGERSEFATAVIKTM
jgi:isocitrate dehydrogenase